MYVFMYVCVCVWNNTHGNILISICHIWISVYNSICNSIQDKNSLLPRSYLNFQNGPPTLIL
jgi:hypothetical protein